MKVNALVVLVVLFQSYALADVVAPFSCQFDQRDAYVKKSRVVFEILETTDSQGRFSRKSRTVIESEFNGIGIDPKPNHSDSESKEINQKNREWI